MIPIQLLKIRNLMHTLYILIENKDKRITLLKYVKFSKQFHQKDNLNIHETAFLV